MNLIAPVAFDGYWELHIAIVATVLLAGICVARDSRWLSTRVLRYGFLAAWIVPVAGLSILMIKQVEDGREDSIHVARGFFGVIHVNESDAGRGTHRRQLYHGTIRHGSQLMAAGLQNRATTYYGVDSGVGTAIEHHPRRAESLPLNVGAIGMGAGTLATYGMRGDTLRFYEISPEVADVADRYFAYLNNQVSGRDGYDPFNTTGGICTNWEEAMDDTDAFLQSTMDPDLVVFFTDGNPTVYEGCSIGFACGGCIEQIGVDRAEVIVRRMQCRGIHFFAIGVGNDIDADNLAELIGPKEDVVPGVSDGVTATSGDFTLVPIAELEQCLSMIATESCVPPSADLSLIKSVSDSVIQASLIKYLYRLHLILLITNILLVILNNS